MLEHREVGKYRLGNIEVWEERDVRTKRRVNIET